MTKRARRRARARGSLKKDFEKLLNARVHDEILPDPFQIIGKVARNKSYQWIALSILGDATPVRGLFDHLAKGGWRPVPPRWHPKMPRNRGHIEYGGQVLCWRAVKTTKSARETEIRSAQEMLPHALQGVYEQYGFVGHIGNLKTPTAIHDPNFYPELKTTFKIPGDFDVRLAAAKAQTRVVDGIQCVDITIGFPLSDREVEMAVHLDLDAVEYARRRVIMHSSESGEPNVLVEVVPGVYRFAEIKLDK